MPTAAIAANTSTPIATLTDPALLGTSATHKTWDKQGQNKPARLHNVMTRASQRAVLQQLSKYIQSLLGLLKVVRVTLVTVTVPKLSPIMEETSPEFRTISKLLWAALALALFASVNATVWATMTDPTVTLSTVTLAWALILARMFASKVLMNCNRQMVN